MLGHADSTCDILFENPDGFTGKAYGIWMRTNANTRDATLSRAKWLWDGRPKRSSDDGESDRKETRMEMDSPGSEANPKGKDKV